MAEAPDELLQRYSTTLEQLATSPFNRELYLERIGLAKELGLGDEVENGKLTKLRSFAKMTSLRSLLPQCCELLDCSQEIANKDRNRREKIFSRDFSHEFTSQR